MKDSLPERFAPLRTRLVLPLLFFLISLSLGYPTLARYAPRETPGLRDVKSYAAMVEGRPANAHWHQFRVLIPTLARPVRAIADGRIGSWDPTTFSLLVVNSAFVGWAALLLLSIGMRFTGDPTVAFCASLLYLLSFNVPNLMLAGLVDSVEAWAMLAATWALVAGQWKLLPLVGAVAAAGKDTSVALLMVFCITWYVALARQHQDTRGLPVAIGLMIGAQIVTIVAIQSAFMGRFVLPRDLVVGPESPLRLGTPPWAHVFNREMLFSFGWMFPLALFRLGRFSRPWIVSSAATLAAVAVIAIRFAIDGNTSRPAFNVAGPILILSVALFIADSLRLEKCSSTRSRS